MTSETQSQPLRVCYFGTYRCEYSRNRIMIDGLRRAGVEVLECQEKLWYGIEDRVQIASGGWKSIHFWRRIFRVYWRLISRYFKIGNYDILLVGYPGQFDVFLARILSWVRLRPMVWDIFMSVYLISLERGLDRRSPITIQAIKVLEKFACHLPEMLILDTNSYAEWFEQVHGITFQRFRLVPTGADDRIFFPREPTREKSNYCNVLYYGSYIPNHDVINIIHAANMLKEHPKIQFIFIGDGPDRSKAEELAQNNNLTNICFLDWVDQEKLTEYIANADICLGAFGKTPQSMMTIQNKIYEGLAMRKAVISGDSPAVRKEFTHARHIYLCERGQPEKLAEAIIDLAENPQKRETIAENGYMLFCEKFNLDSIGNCFSQHLKSLYPPVN